MRFRQRANWAARWDLDWAISLGVTSTSHSRALFLPDSAAA